MAACQNIRERGRAVDQAVRLRRDQRIWVASSVTD